MNDILFDQAKFNSLLEKASKEKRLRACIDLRTSPEECTQRILNGLIPGTVVPIHRHETCETIMIIKGRITEVFFDNEGNETERYELCQAIGNFGICIPENTWHTVIVHESSITFEGKAGKYKPNTEVCPFESKFKR